MGCVDSVSHAKVVLFVAEISQWFQDGLATLKGV